MENKDDVFIWSDNWWIEDNKSWFVGGMSNILFCIDLNTNECESAVYIPDTNPNKFRLTPICMKYGSDMICFPGLGECIWIYNLESQSFSKIDIDNSDKVQLVFQFWRYEDKIFAVSEEWDRILEIDINQKKVEYYIVCTGDSFAKSIFVDNELYSLSIDRNKVYQFNLDTKKVENYIIPKKDGKFYTICFDGEKFWLSGYKKEIYVWNKETDSLITIDEFPADFGIYDFIGNADTVIDCEKEEYECPACPTFLYSVIVGEYVWFIPFMTNKIIYADKKRDKLYAFEIDEENETRESLSANMLHHKYLLEYIRENRYIGLFSLKNNRILEIDAEELRYQWKDYVLSEKCLKQCCEIIKRDIYREGDPLEKMVYGVIIETNNYNSGNKNGDHIGATVYEQILIDSLEQL